MVSVKKTSCMSLSHVLDLTWPTVLFTMYAVTLSSLFACWLIFHAFVVVFRIFFKDNFFKNILSGKLSVSKVWIQIRTDIVGPDLGPNCLQRLSADDKSSCKQEMI